MTHGAVLPNPDPNPKSDSLSHSWGALGSWFRTGVRNYQAPSLGWGKKKKKSMLLTKNPDMWDLRVLKAGS